MKVWFLFGRAGQVVVREAGFYLLPT